MVEFRAMVRNRDTHTHTDTDMNTDEVRVGSRRRHQDACIIPIYGQMTMYYTHIWSYDSCYYI